MSERLLGRTAVITGGGSGIGRETALRFAAEGAVIGVLDLDLGAAGETVALVEEGGGRAIAVKADVADATSVEAAFGLVAGSIGKIDVVFNNAGVFSRGSVAVAEEEDWDRCFAVNVKGVYLCARAALKYMAPEPSSTGSIINTASVAGLVGVENAAGYCAAKGAVIALTRSMAVDLAPRQVRVNAICPGTVQTPLIEPLLTLRGGGDYERGLAMTLEKYPIGRLGQPGDIANLALFLASAESSFLTGSIIAADGGMTAR